MQDRGNHDDAIEQERQVQSCNVVAQLGEQMRKISFGEPNGLRLNDLPRMTNSKQLYTELVGLCNEVYRVLGPYNLEATYQRALARELQNRGVLVKSEIEIPIEYKGQHIATRRVDLYLKLDQPVLLELKAVVTGLKTEHLKQLKYYMTHLKVTEGYLINFPHITGFPDQNNVLCVEHVLQPQGGVGVSDRVTRSSTPRKNLMPTIIHVQQIKTATKMTGKKSTVDKTTFFELVPPTTQSEIGDTAVSTASAKTS